MYAVVFRGSGPWLGLRGLRQTLGLGGLVV